MEVTIKNTEQESVLIEFDNGDDYELESMEEVAVRCDEGAHITFQEGRVVTEGITSISEQDPEELGPEAEDGGPQHVAM